MKVLVVSEPTVDGVFRYVESLCHFLIDRGAEVHLAYSDRRTSDRLLPLVERVEGHGGRTLNLRTSNRPSLADWNAFRSLLKLARTVRPDVIHSHSSKAGFFARLLPLAGFRTVQFYHPHAYVGMRPVPGRLDPLYNLIEAILGRTAFTINVSETERSFAVKRLKIPSGRVFVNPNGVDTDVFSPVPVEEKRRLREELGLPLDQPILGFIGRASMQKDPVTLYRAFAWAATKRPITLFHVGTGELDAELERLTVSLGIGGRIIRRKYMSAPVNFYRAVDGFILTSRYEGFSLAVLEALAADLPVILSDAPGNRDLFGLPLSHLWKESPEDVAGFGRAIVAWHDRLQHPEPINHREIACAQFDIRERLSAVLGLYSEMTGILLRAPHGPHAMAPASAELSDFGEPSAGSPLNHHHA